MIGHCFLQLLCYERWRTQRRAEDGEPLVTGWEGGVANPSFWPQMLDVWWLEPGTIPHPGLAAVELDVGMLEQVVFEQRIDVLDAVWRDQCTHIIEECEEMLT